MDHVIVRHHEIGLKGKNRSFFEQRLADNIHAQLAGTGLTAVKQLEGRTLCHFRDGLSPDVLVQFSRVFGVASFSPVERVAAQEHAIMEEAVTLVRERGPASFAVRTKRSDKRFPKKSDEMNRDVGAAVVAALGTRVDLTNPALILEIEITAHGAFLSAEKFPGACGLPVGSSGRVVAMLSGGIDSPVAAWKIMKRGCEIIFLHFHSYPHTSKASVTKVQELAAIVGAYQPASKVYLVPFAEVQREIVMRCTPKYRVLLYRRLMLRIAELVAASEGATALATGESIGQVASQTIPNITAVEASTQLPIFRPLIGDDKEEIITTARRIGTFDTSIQPHDDCCTLFVPASPATHARVADLDHEMTLIDHEKLAQAALASAEIKTL